jgi:hypothetical protein
MMPARVFALSALLSVSCATAPPTTLRSLPTTLSHDAARLLETCGLVESAFAVEVRCPDGVTVISHRQPVALEAPFLADAADRAHFQGARLEWSDGTITTDEGPVPVREARFIAVDGDTHIGSLFGVGRLLGEEREDIWCVGDPTRRDHCLTILTAMLQKPSTVTTSSPTAPTADASGGTRVAGQPALVGRALSLPTTCSVERQQPDGGRYRCGSVTLMWHTVTDMDDGANEAEALLSSLPADDEPATLNCRLGYEASLCRGTTAVVVGTAFVDGVAIVGACIGNGADDVRAAAPCRALMNGAW